MKQFFQQQQGAILIEYTLLMFFVGVAVFVFWHGPGGFFDLGTQELLESGKFVQGLFQRLTAGITLPVP